MTRTRLARRPAVLEAEPDLTKPQKAAIVRALRWGWDEVLRQWPDVVETGREEEITAKLCDVLCEQTPLGKRRAPGLSQFETVNRGAKTQGSNNHIEYQPDLAFRPILAPRVRNRNRWAWFVECKIINGGSSVRLYCENGVQKYIDGRYAARMPSAAMLAYVRDAQEPRTRLGAILQDDYGAVVVFSKVRYMLTSQHDRAGASPRCVPIELTHLWLSAP